MDENRLREQIHYAIDAHSPAHSPDPYRVQRVLHAAHSGGRGIVKRKFSVGLVLALVLVLMSLTALAVALLTGMDIVEQEAVPMAQQNDSAGYVQESFSHEELVQLIATLNENGITLEEDTNIMKALRNGQGYWEEETIMAICREAFGGLFYEWTIEQKHWFEEMMVQIGFSERNDCAIPGEGDMTIPEAKTHAAKLLYDEYGVTLPTESNDQWKLREWFYAPWTDMDGHHSAKWDFEYDNVKTGVTEYSVSFDPDGVVIDIGEAGFHGEVTAFESYSLADRYFSDKYGAKSDWTIEAWAEFGEAIKSLEPESVAQWCYMNAGYRLPPEGAISCEQAVEIAMEDVALTGETEIMVICCTANERPIYKVRLSIHFPGNETNASYDAIWCLELDCMTGEILDKWEYTYGPDSKPIRMYVPFSVHESAPSFDKPAATEDPAQLAEKERQARAYEAYRQQYGDNWYFWPLEAQKDALGGEHHVPVEGELTREEVVAMALQAIEGKPGKEALEDLDEYQIGAICCRYEESEGVRFSWVVYVTSDPETMGNGFQVNIIDFPGVLETPEIEVQRANAGNG